MQKDETKNCAIKIFAAKGYHDTTMNEIAESVGLTKPAIYYHFKSKSNLFSELLEDQSNFYALELRKTYEKYKDQPLECTLEAVFCLFIKYSSSDIYLLSKRSFLMASFEFNDELKSLTRQSVYKRNDLWTKELTNIIKSKVNNIDEDNLKVFLVSIFLFMKGFTDWILINNTITESELLALAHKLWLNFWNGNKLY